MWRQPDQRHEVALDNDLTRVKTIVKLGGFASTPDFTGQPGVINGCSDLMVEVFGDAGRHARSSSRAGLPLWDTRAEIDAVVEIA